jgi:hypothetical protein
MGDALPEGALLRVGDGYRLEASMSRERDRPSSGEGDLDRTERDDADEGGVERGEEAADNVRGVDVIAPSMMALNSYAVGQ